MASVQELLAAAKAKRSPLIGLLEGAAQGFGSAMPTANDMISWDQAARQEQEKRQQRLDDMKTLQMLLTGQQDQKLSDGLQAAGPAVKPLAAAPRFESVTYNPRSGLTIGLKRNESAKSLEAILAEKVNKGQMTIQEAYIEKAKGSPTFGKPPKGYRYLDDGTLEPIPGSLEAAKMQATEDKKTAAAFESITQADRIMAKVDQALDKVGLFSVGLGASLSGIPGTKARDLAADLETIKANLGFKELQAMRQSSPTGGALGAISDRELTALSSTLSSLDQKQSPEQIRRNLNEVKDHYAKWKSTVNNAPVLKTDGAAPVSAPKKVGRFDIIGVE